MEKRILTFCILSFLCFLYSDSTDFTVEKILPIENFKNLILEGNIDFFFTQSDDVSLVLKVKKESDFEHLKYEYKRNTLTIINRNENHSKSRRFFVIYNNSEITPKIMLYVNAPNIEEISKSGGGIVNFSPGAVLPKLDLKHSAGGRTELNDIIISFFNLNKSGGGVVNLSGTADFVNLQTSGGGNINAEKFIIKKAKINSSGGGRINAQVSEELHLTTSGGGSVNLSGTAEVAVIQTSGGGTLNAENLSIKKANITTSGGGRITANVSDLIEINTSGGSTINLSGTANYAGINQRSGGRLNAGDFVIENANINLSGGVSGTIHVTEMLDIKMSGGGRLLYRGNPRIKQSLSGGASLINEDYI